MHKKLSLGLYAAFAGNLLFVLFAVLAYWYYKIYDPSSGFVKFLEKATYTTLFLGFISLVASEVLFCMTLRMRRLLKSVYGLYIVMEAVMMYLELNSARYRRFYEPYSFKLAVIHSLLSAVVCFIFVYLDPYKVNFEVVIIVCIGLIMGGMFGNLMGIRIYFSILVNAIAYSLMFGAIIYMLKKEIIEIDCYGDSARVAEYKSVFFEEEVDDDDAEDESESTEDTDNKTEQK